MNVMMTDRPMSPPATRLRLTTTARRCSTVLCDAAIVAGLACGAMAATARLPIAEPIPPSAVATLAAVVTGVAVLALALRVVRPAAPLVRLGVVPGSMQAAARWVVERSHLGVGSLRGWTLACATTGLADVAAATPPASDDELDTAELAGPAERTGPAATASVAASSPSPTSHA